MGFWQRLFGRAKAGSGSHGREIVRNDHGAVFIDTSTGRLTILGPGGGSSMDYAKLKGDPAFTVSILMRIWRQSCQGDFPFEAFDLERIQQAIEEA